MRPHAQRIGSAGAGGRIASRRAAQGPDLGAWIDRTRPASRHLPPAAQGHIARGARQLQATIAGFARDHVSFGFVHSDLHLWNLLFAGDSAGAIDFSDCGWGHYALDLAATLQYLTHPWVGNHDQRPRFEGLRDALLAGYASERALPPRVDEQIDAFIALRTINTVEWSWTTGRTPRKGPGGRASCSKRDACSHRFRYRRAWRESASPPRVRGEARAAPRIAGPRIRP